MQRVYKRRQQRNLLAEANGRSLYRGGDWDCWGGGDNSQDPQCTPRWSTKPGPRIGACGFTGTSLFAPAVAQVIYGSSIGNPQQAEFQPTGSIPGELGPGGQQEAEFQPGGDEVGGYLVRVVEGHSAIITDNGRAWMRTTPITGVTLQAP